MIGRLPLPPHPTLWADNGCGDQCPCGFQRTSVQCPPIARADTVSGSDADLGATLAEIGGLDLSRTRLRPQGRLDLPDALLQVDGSAACRGVHRSHVAVTFGVLRNKVGPRSRRSRPLTEVLNVPASTAAGVLLFANDIDLEDLWTRRREWAARLAELEPAFVVLPDFSLWAGDHALATRYNLVRSVRFVDLLQNRGLAVVPHFYWATYRDMSDIASWIDTNRPEVIATDMQCQPRPGRSFLLELAWLRQNVAHTPRLLVAGMDAGRGLERVRSVWPHVTVTRNYVPEVATHVDVSDGPGGRPIRGSSDDPPAVLLARRFARVEDAMRS